MGDEREGFFRKKGYKKFLIGFLGIFVLALAFVYGAPVFSRWYRYWQDDQFQKKVERVRREDYERVMADTFGGKTPQETLSMYIEAVEKKDYELASKYFVEDKRGEELKSFDGVTDEKLKDYVSILKEGLRSEGGYSADKDLYFIETPVYFKFIFYPNGIWKIAEI